MQLVSNSKFEINFEFIDSFEVIDAIKTIQADNNRIFVLNAL